MTGNKALTNAGLTIIMPIWIWKEVWPIKHQNAHELALHCRYIGEIIVLIVIKHEIGTQLGHIYSIKHLAMKPPEICPMMGVVFAFQNGCHHYIFIEY